MLLKSANAPNAALHESAVVLYNNAAFSTIVGSDDAIAGVNTPLFKQKAEANIGQQNFDLEEPNPKTSLQTLVYEAPDNALNQIYSVNVWMRPEPDGNVIVVSLLCSNI